MKKRILVTDDDPDVQEIFKIILEQAGYDVVLNSKGKTILENKYHNPNIFLLDKQLKDVDGLDICRHLKSKDDTKNIPVIMVSATPGLALLAKDAGADAFLEKPCKRKELLDMIARYV